MVDWLSLCRAEAEPVKHSAGVEIFMRQLKRDAKLGAHRQRLVMVGMMLAMVLAGNAQAKSSHEALLAEWYKRLELVDTKALGTLIAPEAVFVLEEFGSSQTKAEFIAYLTVWSEALSKVKVRYKVTSSTSDSATVRACYDFEDGPVLNREIYRFADGRIAGATQARLADGCRDF